MTNDMGASTGVGASGKVRAVAVGRKNFEAGRALGMARRRTRIADLCELVAEGATIRAAAKLIGITETTATSMMAQVRGELGWQAR